MSFQLGRRVRRARDGSYVLKLPKEERELLRDLRDQMRDVLLSAADETDPALTRLFPPAFADQEVERNAEYRRLMQDELLRERLNSLEVMESTLDADRLTEEQLSAWLGSLNDLRLVLGTRLEITEEDTGDLDPDDPRGPAFGLYYYLSWLVEQIVEALSS